MLSPDRLTALAIVALDAARRYGQDQSSGDELPQRLEASRRKALAARAALLQGIESLRQAPLPTPHSDPTTHGTP